MRGALPPRTPSCASTIFRSRSAASPTDGPSFAVERGTITGLIGPNGAGKSTLFNLISGFYEPDGGTVEVNGTDVTGMEPYQVADHGLIRTFQTPRKLEGMTVREAMLVGPRNQPGESFIKLFATPGGSARASRRTSPRPSGS